MMAFGDGHNDLEMLAYVGHSYAMANGAPAVLQTAKFIAPSNNESGVLQVLEDFLSQ
jgi:hydroxymethylpyrimidine pyrophosphatase-like HAD family hydrolase